MLILKIKKYFNIFLIKKYVKKTILYGDAQWIIHVALLPQVQGYKQNQG